MVTSILLTVTDATGAEVAALLDRPDLAHVETGWWCAITIQADLQAALRRTDNQVRRGSLANAIENLRELEPTARLRVQRARVTEGSMPART